MSRLLSYAAALLVFIALALPLDARALPGGGTSPEILTKDLDAPPAVRSIGVDERLGEKIPLDLPLLDETGKTVTLRQLMPADKPVLLSLVYYRCEALCNLVLSGMSRGLRDTAMDLGEDYVSISISIDPKDQPKDSAIRRRRHLQSMGLPETAPWHFLTAEEASIKPIADALGFRYTYDAETKQYAHAAVVFALSDQGMVSRYLYGAEFPAQDLKLALLEAGQGKVGTTIERIILSCFQYDPASRRYGFYIFGFLRIGALLIFGALATLLVVSWRKELKRGAAA